MLINEEKTHEMIITNFRNPLTLGPSYIRGKEVQRVDSIKILGLTLNSNLKWETELDNKLSKAKKLAYALRHLSFTHPVGDIKQLFESVFIPSLLYCCQTWCNITDGQFHQLQAVCDRASRFANSKVDVRTLVLSNVFDLFVKSLDPSHPLNYITKSCERTNNTVARRPRLLSEKSKSARYHKSFLPTAVRLFNES